MSESPAGLTEWPEEPPELQCNAGAKRPPHDPASWLWSLSMHAILAMVLTVMLAPSRGGHPGEQGGVIGVISAVFRHEGANRGSTTRSDTKLDNVTPVSATDESDRKPQIETAIAFRAEDPPPLRTEELTPEPDSNVPEPVNVDPDLREPPPSTNPRKTPTSKPGRSVAATSASPPAAATLEDEHGSPRPPGSSAHAKHRKTPGSALRAGHSAAGPRAQTGSRAQTGRNRGKPGTTFFGAEGSGKKFVYVIDCSASMSERETYAHARQELLKSLDLLPATALIQVIYYNDEPRAVAGGSRPMLVRNTTAERRKIRQISESVIAGGGTLHLPALQLALKLDPDVIFWLTDADEPLMTDAEVRRVHRDNPRQIPINAIEFGYGPALGIDNFLKRISRDSSGEHQYYELTEPRQPAVP